MSDMSPSPAKNRNAAAQNYMTEDQTTQAMTRTNAYNSAQKIRLPKKTSIGPEHHGMSATIHTHNEAQELPNIKNTAKSKRTIN